ncbi:Neuropeptide F [Armadillidium vulgare]|nr:Neuropeptide F [Armadillidium vulgare]
MKVFVGLLTLNVLLCLFVCASSQRRLSALQLMAGINPEVLAALGSVEAQYPDRPDVFKTPADLRQYLEELNSFYAITGRPRFATGGQNDY